MFARPKSPPGAYLADGRVAPHVSAALIVWATLSTAGRTGPASVKTDLPRRPLRVLPPPRPAGSLLAVAQVIVELTPRFDHHLRQLREQPTPTGQPQPLGAGPLGQLPH